MDHSSGLALNHVTLSKLNVQSRIRVTMLDSPGDIAIAARILAFGNTG